MATSCGHRRRDQLARDVFPAVTRFFWKYAPPHRADDLAQDTMLTILRIADRFDFDEVGSPRSWAFGVCRNVLMRTRRERRRPVPFSVVEGPDGDPLDPADHRERAGDERPPADLDRLRRVMTGLPPDDRELIRLRFHHGLTPLEIAARMVLTPGQVSGRLARILRGLRTEGGR